MGKIFGKSNEEETLQYLKKWLNQNFLILRKELDCNDFYLWLFALQEKMAQIIANYDSIPSNSKIRDEFEYKIANLVEENLGDKKIEIIY